MGGSTESHLNPQFFCHFTTISQTIGYSWEMFITLHCKGFVQPRIIVILARPPSGIIFIPTSLSRQQNMAVGMNALAQNVFRFWTKL